MAKVDPWADDGDDNTEYFHTDHLGTTRFMSEDDGDPTEPVVYTAFGERVSGTNHRYGYDGAYGYQAHDFPSGGGAHPIPYLHLGARYYDPASGRFLQRDPLGIHGGLNVYNYAAGNPASLPDPDGLHPILDDLDQLKKRQPPAAVLPMPAPAPSGRPRPLSPAQELERTKKKIFLLSCGTGLAGAATGAVVGAAVGGPVGAAIGAIIGVIAGEGGHIADEIIHHDEPLNPAHGGSYEDW